MDEAERTRAVTTHLPWGIPDPPTNSGNERLLSQEDYITIYETDLKLPL